MSWQIGADDSDYTYEILKFFMLGANSRVFRPGVKFDYIICMVGDKGAGKSTFFRLLSSFCRAADSEHRSQLRKI